MKLDSKEMDNLLLINVDGRIDFSNTQEFEDALLPLVEKVNGENAKVLIDLSGVPYMSSAGLRVLMLAAKKLRRKESDIVIAALSPMLQEVFRISRFDKIFKIFSSVQDALAEISPAAAVIYSGE